VLIARRPTHSDSSRKTASCCESAACGKAQRLLLAEEKFAKGKIAEGGGELIGSNHPLWNCYRQHFRLHFSDVKEYKNSPYRFGGTTLSFELGQALVEEMTDQLRLLSDLAETVVDAFEPWCASSTNTLKQSFCLFANSRSETC
jgi:hypothetical protein